MPARSLGECLRENVTVLGYPGHQVVGQVKKVGKSRNFHQKVGKSRNFSAKK